MDGFFCMELFLKDEKNGFSKEIHIFASILPPCHIRVAWIYDENSKIPRRATLAFNCYSAHGTANERAGVRMWKACG